MSTQSANTRRIPNPLYAAAGAGDLAYRQLSHFGRQLPAKAVELGDRVAALRPVVTDALADAVREPALRADLDRVRKVAKRNAAVLVSQAQAAQERAATVYAGLVARGERVVGGPYKELEPAGDVVPVDVEPAGAPSAKTTSAAATGGPGTGKSPARAPKKTGPTAVS
jgi:hypothetical protein